MKEGFVLRLEVVTGMDLCAEDHDPAERENLPNCREWEKLQD